jgi:hypothetical protein
MAVAHKLAIGLQKTELEQVNSWYTEVSRFISSSVAKHSPLIRSLYDRPLISSVSLSDPT